ncbi:MAG: 4-(cytidine 5'-diphospho)-2-C-methyl-D-erythritol kinase [Dehalococcoidia bacterium]|nr:4-(cytidine 5'-diphospho)-2-C-methyl-D-erythritol kinase [Dehalococcoidia bacterium]
MYKIKSFAKINLGLEVLSKRNDNFHSIKTVISKISLFDEIQIEKSDFNSVKQLGIKEDENLVTKILLHMQKKYFTEKISIRIKKNIPYSSGLGGGSSNAASVIKGLNEYLELNLDSKEMFDIGLRFGSDIPFFLGPNTALIEGKGEKITFIEKPNLSNILLIYPNILIENKTYKIFSNLKSYTNGEYQEHLLKKIRSRKNISESLFNGLEESALSIFHDLRDIKNDLLKMGLPNISMSGAGPSYFSIIDNEKSSYNFKEIIEKNTNHKCYLVDLL